MDNLAEKIEIKVNDDVIIKAGDWEKDPLQGVFWGKMYPDSRVGRKELQGLIKIKREYALKEEHKKLAEKFNHVTASLILVPFDLLGIDYRGAKNNGKK